MKETYQTSTKKEFEEFKKTLGQTKKSNCFKDFVSDLRNG